MSNVENILLEHMRAMRASLDALHTKIDELTNRMGGVEQGLAHLHRRRRAIRPH